MTNHLDKSPMIFKSFTMTSAAADAAANQRTEKRHAVIGEYLLWAMHCPRCTSGFVQMA